MTDAERLERLTVLEGRLGCRLPEDYRRFLLSGPSSESSPEELPENEFTVMLHALDNLGTNSLVGPFEDGRDNVPDWFLPIGEYGVVFGVGVSGEQRGQVYQWDMENEVATHLFDSFDAFLGWIQQQESRWEEQDPESEASS